jgi:hypothetical protein
MKEPQTGTRSRECADMRKAMKKLASLKGVTVFAPDGKRVEPKTKKDHQPK